MPAEAVAGTAPEVDAARFAALDAYLTNLPEAGFGSVKAPDFNTELAGGTVPFILDVRSQAEWDADGHIDGSVLVPISDLPANLAQLPEDKAAPIVTTCKSVRPDDLAALVIKTILERNNIDPRWSKK
jgi:rhodanese-related sulfurtransferase